MILFHREHESTHCTYVLNVKRNLGIRDHRSIERTAAVPHECVGVGLVRVEIAAQHFFLHLQVTGELRHRDRGVQLQVTANGGKHQLLRYILKE